MKSRITRMILCMLCMCLPLTATAGDEDESLVFDPQVFESQREELEQAVRRSDRYAEIRTADRARVFDALASMSALLAGVQRIDELDMDKRVAVFNLQEEINTILTRAQANSRLICERKMRTGSHLIRSQCQSVADRKATRERGQEVLRDYTRRPILRDET